MIILFPKREKLSRDDNLVQKSVYLWVIYLNGEGNLTQKPIYLRVLDLNGAGITRYNMVMGKVNIQAEYG